MKTKKRRIGLGIIFCLALVGVILGSCTNPERQYLPVTTDTRPEVPKNNPKCGTNYSFSVIEFDDQGEMWQRAQLYRTMDLIESVKSNGLPVTVVIFVHGWKNDASPEANNLNEFQQFVTNIAQVYSSGGPNGAFEEGGTPRQFIGVYIAWRGNMYRTYPQWAMEVPLDLTFWNRKRIAGQVAGVSCTEAILSLAAQTRMGESDNAMTVTNNHARSQVILVGHSFGGLIVERAVTQAMLGTMLANVQAHAQERKEKTWRPRPPFEMVLLVNPASESLVAKKMIEAMDNPLISKFAGVTNEDARPWIISVSSKADWATRLAFPLGRKLGSWQDSLRAYDPQSKSGQSSHYPTNYQSTYYDNTAPQNDAMITHIIHADRTLENTNYNRTDQEHLFRWLLRVNLETTTNRLGTNHFNLTNEFLIAKQGSPPVVYAVVPSGNASPTNHPGYWIVQAPKEIIPDHDTIFTEEFYAMCAGLFRMSQYHPREHERDKETNLSTNRF